MKKFIISNLIKGFEIGILIILMQEIIIPDWEKIPVVKDYFALMIIIELSIDLYNKLKNKI